MKGLRKIIFFSIVIVTAFFPSIWHPQSVNAQTKPLTYPEIITALNTKLPNKVFKNKTALIDWLIVQIKQRKVDKPLTKETEEILRQSGGTDLLILAIQEQTPKLINPFDSYNWNVISGDWKFDKESLLQNNELAKPALIVAKNTNLSSYTLTVKAQRTKGTDGFSLIFNFQNPENYVFWDIGSSYTNILINGILEEKSVLEYFTNGKGYYWIASATPQKLENNRWYEIKIIVNRNQVKGFIDDKLKLNMELPPELSTSGSFGFRSWEIKTEFKDLKVQVLK